MRNINNYKFKLRVFMGFAIAMHFALFNLYAQGKTEGIDSLFLNVESEGHILPAVIIKKTSVKGKLPVIVFLAGSGEGSTMKSYQRFTDFFFNQQLLETGFALVYFDKRGLGKSEGIWYETNFEERALDAASVAKKISRLDFIDSDNIYVAGHSQGGWIVLVALAKYPELFAGGISMAGPTFGVKRQIINDYYSRFLCKGKSESKAYRKAKRRVNRDLALVSIVGKKGNLRQLNIIKDFEASNYLKKVNSPFYFYLAKMTH